MRRGKAVVEDGRVGVIAIHFFFFFLGSRKRNKKETNKREGHRPPGVISRLADEVLVEKIESVKRGLAFEGRTEEKKYKG